MNKKFFYYAFAVMTAMCLTACGGDDDNNDDGKKENTVNLPTPPNAENATQFILTTPQVPAATTAATEEDAPELKTMDITESNDVMLELKHPETNTVVYVKGKAKRKENKYELSGDMVSGFVEMVDKNARATRAGSGTDIILDI